MKPTLFVLAAGMGSRYGGLKQLDGVGPSGETIMDYSIYDAVRGGFGKVVFVIRHTFENDFREKIIKKYENIIPVELVFQELDYLPEGFALNPERVKPWGTNHALQMGKSVINEPFAVINADDFYGRESFKILADFLNGVEGKKNTYCSIGYRVGNTLSESGAVSRGVCDTNNEGFLTSVTERTHIERVNGKIIFKDEKGEEVELEENKPVSMNMWGFTPDYFQHSEERFKVFLTENKDNIKAEFYIPTVVSYLVENNISTVEVLDTPSKWFGVTYPEDRPDVVASLRRLVDAGEYPEKLW